MQEVLDVRAIAQQIEARIKQVEEQLTQHKSLTNELERLRDALSRLEGEARSRSTTGRNARKPVAKSARGTTRTRAVEAADSPDRAPRGQNKARVLDALAEGPMTASEIARATGIGTGTVSTTLTKMTKSGELSKAERGYMLPQ